MKTIMLVFGQHVSSLLTGRDEEGMKIVEQFANESIIRNQQSIINHQSSNLWWKVMDRKTLLSLSSDN